MRRTLLVGTALVLVAWAAVWLSAWADLELEPVAVLGIAVGAVLALVTDHPAGWRVTGFVGGFVVAWGLYAVRAAWLPDSTSGKAVFGGAIVALCVALAVVTLDRIPLWSTLLGAAAMVGAYETAYAAAPAETATTSLTAASAMALTVVAGFLAAAALAAPEARPVHRGGHAWLPGQRGGAHETTDATQHVMEGRR